MIEFKSSTVRQLTYQGTIMLSEAMKVNVVRNMSCKAWNANAHQVDSRQFAIIN